MEGKDTVLFVSFDERPLNLRLFCKGEIVDTNDQASRDIFGDIDFSGVRHFVKLNIYCVEHSCGMSVPYYEYKGERNDLRDWCVKSYYNKSLDEYAKRNFTPPDLSSFRI